MGDSGDGHGGIGTLSSPCELGRLRRLRCAGSHTSDGLLLLDWNAIASWAEEARAGGKLVMIGLPHGQTFLRLQNLRGFESILFDMADEEPRLPALIRMAEDFGSQIGPLVSPAHFRRYIKPSYLRLTGPVKARGILVHEHSDGR